MDYQKLEKTSMCYRCKNKEICKTVYQADDCGIQQANWNCSHFAESKPQGDLISREALLKRVDEERKYLLARGQTGAEHILTHNFRELVEGAPAEKLEEIISKFRNTAYRNGYITGLNKRPQGEWIFGSTLGHSWMKCSNCCVSQSGQTLCWSYCPNCGAEMKGGAE